MMQNVAGQLLAALRAMVAFSLLLGIGYPLAVMGVGQLAFHGNANGSLVTSRGVAVGSDLIGQSFTDALGEPLPQFFQSRPSNAGDGYDPTSTAASNRGPEDVTDTADRVSLLTQICARSAAVGTLDGVSGARTFCSDGKGSTLRGAAPASSRVPVDAVTASGSGLDPDISPAYARLQVARVPGHGGFRSHVSSRS